MFMGDNIYIQLYTIIKSILSYSNIALSSLKTLANSPCFADFKTWDKVTEKRLTIKMLISRFVLFNKINLWFELICFSDSVISRNTSYI